jgi:hypothetical protein
MGNKLLPGLCGINQIIDDKSTIDIESIESKKKLGKMFYDIAQEHYGNFKIYIDKKLLTTSIITKYSQITPYYRKQYLKCNVNSENIKQQIYNIVTLYLKSYNYGYHDAYVGLGNYYNEIENDSNTMIKYLKIASNDGCINAMKLLVKYYEEKSKFDLMEKYYLMAIDKGQTGMMIKFGDYHRNKKNYELMNKYYSMALELGDFFAYTGFAHYYHNINIDHEKMKKYYHDAILSFSLNSRKNVTFGTTVYYRSDCDIVKNNMQIQLISHYNAFSNINDSDFELMCKCEIINDTLDCNNRLGVFILNSVNIDKYYKYFIKNKTTKKFRGMINIIQCL